jgi:type I restriction enzyme S subunit
LALYREKDFQDTQEGKFPKEWDIFKLNRVLSLEYGKGLPEQKRKRGTYPVVGSNGVIGYHSRALVKGPGIVIGRKGTIGAVTWISSDFWPIDTTYYAKVTAIDVDLKWLFYKLVHCNLPKLSLADVVPGLKRELVNNLAIILPSVAEQRAIAGVLGVVDSAIELADKVIAKTERLKKGLMQKLLTEGIGHKESKDTEIGKIPEEWNVVRLGSLVRVQGGFAFKSEDYVKDGVPLVRIANVSFGHIEFTDLAKLPHAYLKQYSEFALEENDIVIVLTRPITEGGIKAGMTERIHTPALLNQRVGRFRIRDKTQTSPDFLFHVIFSDGFIRQVRRGLVTMNQPNISTKEMEKFTIALPPFEEQTRIAETLSTVDSKLGIERKQKAKLERIKQGLMDLLLTGKIRVKVD